MTLTHKDIDGHLLKHAAGHCGANPCITVQALEELARTRELLKGLMDYHNKREACVHMEGPQFCDEALAYLREAGVE